MQRQWTQEQKDYIIKSYTIDGLTCTEIARKFGAKPDTISKYLKSWGIEIKKAKTKNRLLKHDYFSIIDSPTKAYFLGLLFADGNIALDPENKRSPAIRIELSEEDQEILILFQKELNSNSSLRYDKRSGRPRGTYSFSVRSQQLADDLAKFNIVPNKTYVVTSIIFPDKYLIDFLRGYIDGDGSIFYSCNSWHINITGHTESVIKQFQEKIDLLINKNPHNKITNYNNVYKAVWNGEDAIKLCKLLYNNDHIALTRKRAKAMAAQEDKRVEDIV